MLRTKSNQISLYENEAVPYSRNIYCCHNVMEMVGQLCLQTEQMCMTIIPGSTIEAL